MTSYPVEIRGTASIGTLMLEGPIEQPKPAYAFVIGLLRELINSRTGQPGDRSRPPGARLPAPSFSRDRGPREFLEIRFEQQSP